MANLSDILNIDCPPASGGGINYTVDVFTSSGTYTKPANLDYAYVLMVSGGGGGGSGRRGAAGTNRGGGVSYNGAMLLSKWLNSDLSATESVTVGAGGVGGPGITTDNSSGISGTTGGESNFKSSLFSVNGGSSLNGPTVVWSALTGASPSIDISLNYKAAIAALRNPNAIGTSSTSDRVRGNGGLDASTVTPYGGTSIGGQIRNTNVQENAGVLGGFYNDSNVLTDEITGTLPEAGNGVQPTQFYTFGQVLVKFFPWFDPADANYNVGRGGLGGGCGDTAGTVAGGNGADALGYGGGGGGGGASTNGANSGAGGNGSQGIVIIINVLTS